MRANTFFNGKEHVQIGSMLVEKDALNIVEKLKEYDPDLDVMCADPMDPRINFATAPFIIIRRREDGTHERIMEAWELDDRILERVFAADCIKGDNPLDLLFQMEAKKKAENDAAWREKADAAAELSLAVIKDPKSSYTFRNKEGDKVAIHENKPPTRNDDRTYIS